MRLFSKLSFASLFSDECSQQVSFVLFLPSGGAGVGRPTATRYVKADGTGVVAGRGRDGGHRDRGVYGVNSSCSRARMTHGE